jgi:hypothetical protein
VDTPLPEGGDDQALVDRLIDRATRAPEPEVAVLSVLRTLATYIYYVGRYQDGADDQLFRIREADADAWLERLASIIEARSMLRSLDGA